ncbi:hypothetical protein SAMN05444266_104209 [Chitinophaga jiangningensis]|uniref:Response regulatory domain-containing protein n=1 Tax=Chitinophaga jiangningensis TaxID=1419482 RepID=A0A1M7C6A3_9BACT|nr:response regulator transcription factor [Chitinophaga jiangningensis]SHL62713.1 hypothetical protein SAMN05444266_104209 [Chitinophaga jiangningensis]
MHLFIAYSKSFNVGINIFIAANPSLYRFKLQRLLSACHELRVQALSAGEWTCPDNLHLQYDAVLIDSRTIFHQIESTPWNAFRLASFIRGCSELVPLIMLGNGEDLEEKIRGLQHGCDDFLDRSVSVEELECRIRNLVKRARRQAAFG